MNDDDGQSEAQDEEILEVRQADLGEARRRELFAALTAEAPPTPAELRARQQAFGDHRRYVGPLFADQPLTAAVSPDAEEQDIEPTEVAAPPESEDSEPEPEPELVR